MLYTKIVRQPVAIIGLKASNLDLYDMPASSKRIGELWGQYFQRAHEILHVLSNDDYSIYTEYTQDGKYSCIIGKLVAKCESVPEGMICVQLPGGAFARYEVADKNQVFAFWQKYWQTSHDYTRVFTSDFEVYTPHGVEVFIAIN